MSRRGGSGRISSRSTCTTRSAPGSRGGLRIVDIADPHAPREVGHFIPEPAPGRAAPQSNDVDARGLIYIVDRYAGFDILELRR